MKLPELQIRGYFSILNVGGEVLRRRHLSEPLSLQTFLNDFTFNPHDLVVKNFLVLSQLFNRYLFKYLAQVVSDQLKPQQFLLFLQLEGEELHGLVIQMLGKLIISLIVLDELSRNRWKDAVLWY